MTAYKELDTLLERVRDAERTARRRAAILLVPSIVIAFSLLAYTTWRFDDYRRRVSEVTQEITTKEELINRLTAELDTAQQRLDQAISLGSHIFEFDWEQAKVLASRNPQRGEILIAIMEEKLFGNVQWRVDGTSRETGFDSPNFAFFVLGQTGRLPPTLEGSGSGDVSSQTLKDALAPSDRPQFGDLAFYGGGFVMFHFIDELGRPFVAGMTPFGILALTPEFGSLVEYRRIP